MNPKFLRRAASAAMYNAFARHGLPMDQIALPPADDLSAWHVASSTQVLWRWPDSRQRYRAVVNFEDPDQPMVGEVVADSIDDLVLDPYKIDPDQFDLPQRPGYVIALPFDISDIYHREAEDWLNLPEQAIRTFKHNRYPEPASYAKRAMQYD